MLNIDKRKWLIFGLTCVVLSGLVMHSAGRRLDSHQQKHEETPLHEEMKRMDASYTKLRRQIEDPGKNEGSLKLLATMQKGAATSLGLVPEKMKTLPANEQDSFILEYKRRIVSLIGGTLDVEAALLDSDNAKAKAALKQLRTIKRESHQRFQIEEEH